MTNAESLIRAGMAEAKIKSVSELGLRIGMKRSTLARRLKHPSTFIASEILAIGNVLGWSNEKLGELIRSEE